MREPLPWLCLLVLGLGAHARALARHLAKHMVAEAGRSPLGVDPNAGEQFEQGVFELFSLNPTVVARLQELFR